MTFSERRTASQRLSFRDSEAHKRVNYMFYHYSFTLLHVSLSRLVVHFFLSRSRALVQFSHDGCFLLGPSKLEAWFHASRFATCTGASNTASSDNEKLMDVTQSVAQIRERKVTPDGPSNPSRWTLSAKLEVRGWRLGSELLFALNIIDKCRSLSMDSVILRALVVACTNVNLCFSTRQL